MGQFKLKYYFWFFQKVFFLTKWWGGPFFFYNLYVVTPIHLKKYIIPKIFKKYKYSFFFPKRYNRFLINSLLTKEFLLVNFN